MSAGYRGRGAAAGGGFRNGIIRGRLRGKAFGGEGAGDAGLDGGVQRWRRRRLFQRGQIARERIVALQEGCELRIVELIVVLAAHACSSCAYCPRNFFIA
jgi:hypothetical protein